MTTIPVFVKLTGVLAMLGMFVFSNLINLTSNLKVIDFDQTENSVIFYLQNKKDLDKPIVVDIDKKKNEGKLKIGFRQGEMELNLEHQGEISKIEKELIDRVITQIENYTDNRTFLEKVGHKVRNHIKEYLKIKKKNLGKKLLD